MSTPTSKELVHAYRHLSKAALHAVQFAKPSRYIARDHLRDAFRQSPVTDYDAVKIQRTVEFLENAAKATGLEHKIVKNVLLVWFWRIRSGRVTLGRPDRLKLRNVAYEEFEKTIEKLNESMNLCIK